MIVRLTEIADPARAAAEAEAIFWQSAGTQSFAGDAERSAYRELWFGRYLQHAPGEFFLTLGLKGDITGYLAGSLISNAPPLPGPDYYDLFPPALIARYPAHLHVNVRADCQGAGIGTSLVRAFADHCRSQGLPGMHAITAAGSRSASFFETCGLAPRASATWHVRLLTFLAADI